MPKTLKTILVAIAGLLALLLIAIGIFAATFDPNDYKPQLIGLVQEKTQRTLKIPGDIELGFFPNIALELGPVSLSQRNSDERFASVDSARLSLALLPLLAKKVVVDKIGIAGLRADIVRYKDGTTNYDDLLSKDEGGGQQILFDIDSIRVSDAQVVYEDRQESRRFEIAGFDLQTGRIADRVPGKLQLSANVKSSQPAVDAHVALATGFTLDIGEKRYVLDGLDAEIKGALLGYPELTLEAGGDVVLQPDARRFSLGDIELKASGKRGEDAFTASLTVPKLAVTDDKVNGDKLSGEAKLLSGSRTITAGLSVPGFDGSPQAFKIPAFALDATVKDEQLDLNARLSGPLEGNIDKQLFTSPQMTLVLQGKQGEKAIAGTLTTPVTASLQTQQISLPKLAAELTLPNPGGGTMALKSTGKASVELDKEAVAAELKGKLDQSSFEATLGMNGFSAPAYSFDIGIDQLDLDRYREKNPQAAGAPGAGAPKPGNAKPEAASGPAIDLSPLQALRASGNLRIARLTAANIKSSDVRLQMRAANGKLEANPLSANLYGGKLAGTMTLVAAQPNRFAMQQTLSGIEVGPLLKDAVGKEPMEGKGNVHLDVHSAGAAVDAVLANLGGSARLELRDGAVRGVNIAQAVRSAKAKLGELRGDAAAQSGTATGAEKTDFSELNASFQIARGVAHNEDLLIKSPLARITGAGDINLAAQRLDYLVRATIVSTLQGQGGPELQALKGLTVPVKLSGPFDAIDWRIDFAGLASEAAKQKIDEKKDELKAKAQRSLEEEKGKLQDQLKDQLKGLFKK